MKAGLIASLVAVAGMAAARTLSLDTIVCNPGARVIAPLTLDDAAGVASVYAQVVYDPLAATVTEVRPGALRTVFGTDFVTTTEAGAFCLLAFGRENAKSGSGTVAEAILSVREGSEGLVSALTLADARLDERTQTRDLADDEPLSVRSGLLRVFAPDGACEVRQGEGATLVAAGTTLRRLTLEAGDALQANAAQTPIVVTEALSAKGALRILPPEGGWATARYELLRCPTPGLSLTVDAATAPDAYTLTELTEGGTTTYVLDAVMHETIPIVTEAMLSPADENLLRDLLGSRLEGVREIRAEGTREAILAGLDLGIVPATALADGILTARFEMPTLRIVAFDPQAGTARVRVIPAEGATIARPLATGVLRVRAAERLGQTMEPLDAEVDAAEYLSATTKGEAGLTFRLGRNLFIKVVAEHPATQQADTEKEEP